jgi:excisionase family DNA binding protein
MVAQAKAIEAETLCPWTVEDIRRFYEPDEPAQTMKAPDPLIDAKAAGKILAISEQTVWAMAKRGELPCVRFGKKITRFDRSDLLAWVGRHKIAAINA